MGVIVNVERNDMLLRTHVQGRQIFLPKDSWKQQFDQSAGLSCVEVFVEGPDAMFKCKAIVDPKSSVNLCTKRLFDKLKLPCKPFKAILNVATGTFDVSGN